MTNPTRIEWNGGENPVREGETLVKVWFRNGDETAPNSDGAEWHWAHDAVDWNIIAYAVTPERKPETLRTPDDDCFSAHDKAKAASGYRWNMFYTHPQPRKPETRSEPIETMRDRVAMAALTGLLASGAKIGVVADANRIADAFMAARGDV